MDFQQLLPSIAFAETAVFPGEATAPTSYTLNLLCVCEDAHTRLETGRLESEAGKGNHA